MSEKKLNTQTDNGNEEEKKNLAGLELMRTPFPEDQIKKLPKPTKKQTADLKADWKLGIRCTICGQWHHPDVEHLDYVGHAPMTDRLLDCDLRWSWVPLAYGENGLPLLDEDGGLWIWLTYCGVTRLGYGDAQGKTGGDAMKERIGDAIRNAAMRGGGALDLWYKRNPPPKDDARPKPAKKTAIPKSSQVPVYIAEVQKTKILDALEKAEYPLINFLVKSNVKSLDLLELSRFEGALAHIESVAKSKVKKGE